MLRGDCSVGSARMTSGCKCPCLYLQLLVVLFFFSLMGLLSTHLTPHVCHPSCLGFFPRLLETAGPQVPRLPGQGGGRSPVLTGVEAPWPWAPGSLVTSPCWSSFHQRPSRNTFCSLCEEGRPCPCVPRGNIQLCSHSILSHSSSSVGHRLPAA